MDNLQKIFAIPPTYSPFRLCSKIVSLAVMEGKIRKTENFHILLWLLKDLCWVADFKVAGMIMIVPTIIVAVYITWISRKSYPELMHNIAVVSWICANSAWMTGEFFFNDGTRPAATAFFVTGLLVIGFYYGQAGWRSWCSRAREIKKDHE